MARFGGILVGLAMVLAALVGAGRGFAKQATPITDQTPVATPVGTNVIRVVERAETDTELDLGDPGESIGDMIAFGNPIYDETNTTQVGVDQGSCVLAFPGEAYECSFTVILEGGQLVVQGPFNVDGSDSTLAITGGTGAFAGAQGEMLLQVFVDDSTEADEFLFTFTLI
jgi:hypothetical protein